ncbi:MAG: LTA synthase family protein [Lachnospiraceae bacterium]|nr:LTA synthase family protein [Lachnospiraceae bacterium]
MSRGLQRIKEIGKEILSHRIRMAVGMISSIVLLALSVYFLNKGGIDRRTIISTVICLGVGFFIVCPRMTDWRLSLAAVVCYLAVVPAKMFDRIELPVHDLSNLRDGAELANLLIILLIYAVLLLIFQRVGLALSVGGILILVLCIANYFVALYRNSFLSLNDIMAAGTAATVIQSYDLMPDAELWYTILYFLFFIVLGFWCDIPLRGKGYHIAVTAVSIVYCVFFYCFWNLSDYREEHELYTVQYAPYASQLYLGYLLTFGVDIQENIDEGTPPGYSVEKLLEIREWTEENYESEDQKEEGITPNVILIMNESWANLSVLGNIATTEPVMPFVDSLEENTRKGYLYVNILGGLTANTEFEVLTGDTVSFMTVTAVPYQTGQLDHDILALPSVFEEQGYQTMAMHPNNTASWNRGEAYGYLGFREFIDDSQFQTDYLYVRSFLSDECNYNEIIWQYENRDSDAPLFLFDVTIQNHGNYYSGDMEEMKIGLTEFGQIAREDWGDTDTLETYLNLLKISDDAFQNLIEYFTEVDEPTIICMFGDHQPLFNDHIYDVFFAGQNLTEDEQNAQKYIVPYLVWTNYDADLADYGNFSASYLGAVISDYAGLELPSYYKYLLLMMKEYPEISFRNIEEIEEEEMISNYRLLQYNHLMDPDYLTALFSVN